MRYPGGDITPATDLITSGLPTERPGTRLVANGTSSLILPAIPYYNIKSVNDLVISTAMKMPIPHSHRFHPPYLVHLEVLEGMSLRFIRFGCLPASTLLESINTNWSMNNTPGLTGQIRYLSTGNHRIHPPHSLSLSFLSDAGVHSPRPSPAQQGGVCWWSRVEGKKWRVDADRLELPPSRWPQAVPSHK